MAMVDDLIQVYEMDIVYIRVKGMCIGLSFPPLQFVSQGREGGTKRVIFFFIALNLILMTLYSLDEMETIEI